MRFSIITVVKNGYPEIKNTIKSVLNQDFKDFEYIILDSCSNDGTSEFIKNFKNKKIYYERKRDGGIYHALNKSSLKIKGEYVINLHSGDLFYSNSILQKLNKIIKNNKKYDFFFSNIAYYKKDKVVRLWRMPFKEFNELSFLRIPHTSICVKSKIAKTIYYDTNYKISSDTNYLLKICKSYNGKYLDQFITFMVVGGVSTSVNSFFLKLKEDLLILIKEFGILFIFVWIYKILIKIPGLCVNKKIFTSKLIKQKKINNFF